MKLNNFKQYFSEARINRYLLATGNSTSKSIKLYKANLKISQAFHPLLGVFEVVLRNKLNEILTSYFNDPDWIINQKTGFMSDPSLRFTYKRTGQQKNNDFFKKRNLKSRKETSKN